MALRRATHRPTWTRREEREYVYQPPQYRPAYLMTFNEQSRLRADGAGREATWQVGAATRVITPEEPMRMAGYGARTDRSNGVKQDIHAKAVVFKDGYGNRVAIVAAELLGVTRQFRTAVAQECQDQYGIASDELLINTSHTHTGPEYRKDQWGAWGFDGEDDRRATAYRDRLKADFVEVVGEAIDDLSSAELQYTHSQCGIAMSRRLPTEDGIKFRQYPDGAVDHDVPVLVATEDEEVTAILFGYACHPTSLPGWTKYHGDWAGVAMESLEEEFPEATAAFVQGCGGDIKAYPQDGPERTEQHGQSLANAVHAAIDSRSKIVHGPLRTSLEEITFEYADQPDREELEARVRPQDPVPMDEMTAEEDQQGAYARRLLDELDETGSLRTEFPFPVQAIGFGSDLTILGLAGEVLVDYSLRLKREIEGDVWVAGYSNLGYFYVPSARNIYEGGYESGWVRVYADRPFPPAPDNEDRIVETAVALAERVGSQRRQ